MLKGTLIEFSVDGESWEALGQVVDPTFGTPDTVQDPAEVRSWGLSGSASISGRLQIEVRNYQLEEMACWPVRIVEPAPYAAKSKPWLKRKKGRGGHGY